LYKIIAANLVKEVERLKGWKDGRLEGWRVEGWNKLIFLMGMVKKLV
jgi:hypothetical protein